MAKTELLKAVNLNAKKVAERYLSNLESREKSDLTIESYRWIYDDFFYKVPKDLNEISYEDVWTWLKDYQVNKTPKTVIQRLAALSGLFRYCAVKGYMGIIPIKRWWWPKAPKSSPKHLHKGEMVNVRKNLELLSARDRGIVELLESSGLRRSEVISLNIEDINLNERSGVVTGKGMKVRNFFFSEECSYTLTKYLASRREQTGPLFINRNGVRLSGKYIYLITIKLGKRAKLKKRLHPHVLRHTFGTSMISRGARIEVVQTWMDHKDPKTTKIYARYTPDVLRDVYDRCWE